MPRYNSWGEVVKPKRVPKAIATHPGILEAEVAGSDMPDYCYDIILKEGWHFRQGRTAGCRVIHCNTVAEFFEAEPVNEIGDAERQEIEWRKQRAAR